VDVSVGVGVDVAETVGVWEGVAVPVGVGESGVRPVAVAEAVGVGVEEAVGEGPVGEGPVGVAVNVEEAAGGRGGVDVRVDVRAGAGTEVRVRVAVARTGIRVRVGVGVGGGVRTGRRLVNPVIVAFSSDIQQTSPGRSGLRIAQKFPFALRPTT
jgi:hypothetical protein